MQNKTALLIKKQLGSSILHYQVRFKIFPNSLHSAFKLIYKPLEKIFIPILRLFYVPTVFVK